VLSAVVVAMASYFLVRAYVLRRADANIRDLLLSHRGFHVYVQQVLIPYYDAALKAHRIPAEFYAPQLMSSSYMVRVMHGFFNEERIKAGLPPIFYRMAADNPRNTVNRATPEEQHLIQMFNANRGLHDLTKTVDVDGKPYLERVVPFLPNTAACLQCHGRREDAPLGLQALYPGQGGFNEKLGQIRAVEIVRVPIAQEIQTAAITSAAVAGALVGLLLLAMFNTRLRGLVRARTVLLEEEVLERRRAEAEVRELNQSLERRVEERNAQLLAVNKELDAFAYSVSHDLRAPLRAIDGFSQALEEDWGGTLGEEGRDHLRRVRKACARMGNLIEDLLQLSRLTRREIRPVDLDLSAMALEVADELRAGAPARQVTFEVQPGLRAHGDQTLYRAVLDNLLGNAFKFTAGTSEARIRFGRREAGGQEAFFVEDNGVGFDMQYADKLFGAFQRLHAPEAFEGSGIGLATVQRVILRHGGRVWAESAPGRGATFYFVL
jgi:signal transduction histidine kinase